MKRRISFVLALALMLTMLGGCSISLGRLTSFFTRESQETAHDDSQSEETPPEEMASETVLTETQAPEVLCLPYQKDYGLNPYTCTSFTNRAIFSLLYEPLYAMDSQYIAQPVLAADTAISEDGLTTTITLRQGVKFHSGASLTAEDVVYSYTLARDSSYYDGRFRHFTSVAAQGADTLIIQTDTSYESVALLLDFPIVRKDSGEAAVPDGTGAYRYQSGDVLTAFGQWWGGESPLGYERVELTSCTTATDIRDKFEYGTVNLVYTDPNSTAYATFHNESDYELWSCPTTVMQYVGFNTNSDVFSHSAIRAAVTFAIDRETIVAKDLGGFAEATSLPAPPNSPYYDAGLAADFDLDLSAFRALMEEAQVEDYTDDGLLDVYVDGYPETVGGTMIVSAGSAQRVETANRIAAALMETGIDTFALNKRHFRTKSWARLQVERLLVERMHRYEDGKIAVAPISLSLMDEAGATEEDMEDIAAFLGQIEGVETSVTIRELEDGACKLSVRTSGGLNATRVCALLGGGGHAAAAGCTVNSTLEQAEAAILDAIQKVENDA